MSQENVEIVRDISDGFAHAVALRAAGLFE
jgi:hypothetical protein